MNDRELLEFIAAQIGNLTNQVGTLTTDVQDVKGELKGVNQRLNKIEDRVTVIEQDHGKKLDLLFDVYKQNADKLDRIEKEVSKHEEVILRRIK